MTTNTMIKTLANQPYKQVIKITDFEPVLICDTCRGGTRTTSTCISIKNFPGDECDWLHNFFFGCFTDDDGNVTYFANTCSTLLCERPSDKKYVLGYELGDEIVLDGIRFRIEQAPGHNLKLVRVR